MVSSFQDGDSSRGYQYAYGPNNALKGGDLQGIINAADYIKSLGCNAIWMTPIFNSNGDGYLDSTGYFTYDYFDIDPKFGTKETFKKLVQTYHDKGIYVILDGVFGHHKGSTAKSPSGKSPAGGSNPVKYPGSLDFYKEVEESTQAILRDLLVKYEENLNENVKLVQQIQELRIEVNLLTTVLKNELGESFDINKYKLELINA
jgi:hypothetical protein